MSELLSLDPVTRKPPNSRVKDAASLNGTISEIVRLDLISATHRMEVQRMIDGDSPRDQRALDASGQGGRCNLNFGDGKARLKLEEAGFYDLTESVPTLARVMSTFGDPATWTYNNAVMSEEWHKTLKAWSDFDTNFQLQVKKTCTHGIGFVYFGDDVNWKWEVAGLEEFKVPRESTLSTSKLDMAVVFRDVTIGELYSWIKDVDAKDKRWNLKEVETAIVNAGEKGQLTINAWEKWQTMLKNNDIFASSQAKDKVHLAHAWIKEFDGKVSHFITLRDGGNQDFLFKCLNRFDSIDQCFTFFPYEVGTNGLLHSVRGLAHEVYATCQVLNDLRGQTVDNAKLSGSLLLQPKTATDAEDLAIMFYGGAAIIPPGVTVANGQLNNPSQGILPVIQDMTMLMRRNTGDTNTQDRSASEREKTKFEVQSELTKESVLPTASMNLFYQPWDRHLNEVWRRFQNDKISAADSGGREVMDFRARCVARHVPPEALTEPCRVKAVRAIGFGSPSQRLMALDEFMNYYGSLDPVGQNNLLRARFAEKVGYAQVDDYVPLMQQNGRGPIDVEIAELQNGAMATGITVTVRPNDQHIIHLQSHLPDIGNDLEKIEGGQGTPQLLQVVQLKIQHIQGHMQLLKPDKLQEKVVAELTRQFNNAAERVTAAIDHAERQAQKDAANAPPMTDKLAQLAEEHALRMKNLQEEHDLKLSLQKQEADQKRALDDAKEAAKTTALAERRRLTGQP